MRNFLTVFSIVMALSAPALAATISNCDEIERTISINNAGEIRQHVLAPARSIEANGPMVSVQVEKNAFIRVDQRDVYCVRKGVLSLQMRRPYNSNKR